MYSAKVILVIVLILVSVAVLWDDITRDFEHMAISKQTPSKVLLQIDYVDEDVRWKEFNALMLKRETYEINLDDNKPVNIKKEGKKIVHIYMDFFDKAKNPINIMNYFPVEIKNYFPEYLDIYPLRESKPKTYNPLTYLDFDIEFQDNKGNKHSLKSYLNADRNSIFSEFIPNHLGGFHLFITRIRNIMDRNIRRIREEVRKLEPSMRKLELKSFKIVKKTK